MDEVPKKKTVSVNFHHTLVFLFGFPDPWTWGRWVVPKRQYGITTI